MIKLIPLNFEVEMPMSSLESIEEDQLWNQGANKFLLNSRKIELYQESN